jgi:hypothetical protein
MASARVLTDHDQIRRWAEERNAQPACVLGTGGKGDPGMIRLDFPGFSGKGKLSPLSWRDWFKAFDENGLALLVQDTTARGQKSNFNKLVSRDTAGRRRQPSQRRASAARRTTRRRTASRSRRATSSSRRSSSSSSRRSRSRAAAADSSRRSKKRTR